MEDIDKLRSWMAESRRMVFFGGAGVSTESGIPDFRSEDGLYKQTYCYPPETILSRTFFEHCPEEFFAFYREKMLCPEARPNLVHQRLAALEEAGILSAVVTQNIDGLHQAAGSRRVFELHGRCIGIIAGNVMLFTIWTLCFTHPVFRTAPAAALSNQMWCYMRRASTRMCFRERLRQLPMRIC